MIFYRLLLLCIFSVLQEKSVSLVIFQTREGQNATIMWRFSTSGKKYFCRDECRGTTALVETDNVSAKRGRHSIKFEEGNLYAFIVNLNVADSGHYRIGVGSPQLANSYSDFQIRVLQAQPGGRLADGPLVHIHTGLSGGTVVVICPFLVSGSVKFFCKGNCLDGHILIRTTEDAALVGRYGVDFRKDAFMKAFLLVVTISQLDKWDSGRYSCGLGQSLRSASIQEFDVSVTDGPSLKPSSEFELTKYPSKETQKVLVWPLILCSVLVLLLAAVVLLLFYKWKTIANSRNQRFELHTREYAREDAAYQSIRDVGRDLDHTYCTLKQAQHTQYENSAC
ncbi:uncharacterized protein LOC109528326 [Hippocampus comes]|uniref:uncharacterized protein LOC109528326 n=1 Tax=Hippocampus comes TaxID=109280 RepID=UPI00094EFF3D|nr:PREDICTED: uncharacterized protein LOC109528326 [Hippocampus comes]